MKQWFLLGLLGGQAQTSGSTPAFGSYATPGTVGYLGTKAALTEIREDTNTLPDSNWAWFVGSGIHFGLRFDDTATLTSATLDHLYIRGAIYWNGSGTLTLNNCVVDWRSPTDSLIPTNDFGDAGIWTSTKPFVSAHKSTAKIVATNTTFLGTANDADKGSNVEGFSQYTMTACDLRGTPEGLQHMGDGSAVDRCTIRDIRQTGTAHCNGIFLGLGSGGGGNNVTVDRTYINLGSQNGSSGVTASIFSQNSPNLTNVSIRGCYINGHNADTTNAIRNGSVTGLNVINCEFANGHNAGNEATGTWGTTTGNKHTDGSSVTFA